MAKAKLAYRDNLGGIKKNQIYEKLVLPVFFIFLTAFLGNLVASSLQESAQRRNAIFMAQVESIKIGKEKSSNVLVALRRAIPLYKAKQRDGLSSSFSLEDSIYLRDFLDELALVEVYSQQIVDCKIRGSIKKNYDIAYKQVSKYISCLENNSVSDVDNTNNACEENFDLRSLERMIADHNQALIKSASSL